MNTQDKINALCSKFSASALGQAVYMETKRTTDITELSREEVEALYARFFPKKSAIDFLFEMEQERELKRLRSVIIKEAQFIGIYSPESWAGFNRFMLHKSIFKKALNEYKIEEFPQLIKQFKSISAKVSKAKLIPHTTAWYNELGINDISQN
ncbi:hypothetical protein V3471_00670 [Flavobacterium oreochromis]|uniref:hypothetical protein n=1 Tax=Flavobacterium TaxID=237 RepID=UPI000CDACB92|nr:hypothetical protein BWK58_06520 [Flavobacterium columnare]